MNALSKVKPETFFKIGLVGSVIGLLFGLYSFYDESALGWYGFPGEEVSPDVRYYFTGFCVLTLIYHAWQLVGAKTNTNQPKASNGAELDSKVTKQRVPPEGQLTESPPYWLEVLYRIFMLSAFVIFTLVLFSSLFEPETAIVFHDQIIAFLPASFEPMQFRTTEVGVFLQLQLLFSCLSLLPMAFGYVLSFLLVVLTHKDRPLLHNAGLLVLVYAFAYGAGVILSMMLERG